MLSMTLEVGCDEEGILREPIEIYGQIISELGMYTIYSGTSKECKLWVIPRYSKKVCEKSISERKFVEIGSKCEYYCKNKWHKAYFQGYAKSDYGVCVIIMTELGAFFTTILDNDVKLTITTVLD